MHRTLVTLFKPGTEPVRARALSAMKRGSLKVPPDRVAGLSRHFARSTFLPELRKRLE